MDKMIISKTVEVEFDIKDIVDKTIDAITDMVYDTLFDYHIEDVLTDKEVYSIKWKVASAVAKEILLCSNIVKSTEKEK